MGVSNEDGHLNINADYLNTGDTTDIYLDVIHELVHVKQFMEGRKLLDPRSNYVTSPTEVEACRYSIQEARRLGMSEKRICEYLRTERMTNEDFQELTRILNIRESSG